MAGLCRLDGKIALITGASSGIGAGTAVLFAKLGAKLSLTGRKEDNLKKVAEECEQYCSVKPYLIIADLAIDTDAKRVMEQTIQHYGRLDILVNSAGILIMGGVENTTLEQYDEVLNINTRATFHLMNLAVPHLAKTKGNIVNVSSVNGIRSFPNALAYCISKSAVDQLTKCAALELAPKQIRVNSINPGVILTEIHRRAGLDEEAYQKLLDRIQFTYPLGRPGKVEEAASAVAFLASPDASFITGVQLPVDGGRHNVCPR